MKTNYSEQLTDILNPALNSIYEKIKGKPDLILFADNQIFENGDLDQRELTDTFLYATIEINHYQEMQGNTIYYPYGLSDNGLAIQVLVVDEYGENDSILVEEMDAYGITTLADFLNSKI